MKRLILVSTMAVVVCLAGFCPGQEKAAARKPPSNSEKLKPLLDLSDGQRTEIVNLVRKDAEAWAASEKGWDQIRGITLLGALRVQDATSRAKKLFQDKIPTGSVMRSDKPAAETFDVQQAAALALLRLMGAEAIPIIEAELPQANWYMKEKLMAVLNRLDTKPYEAIQTPHSTVVMWMRLAGSVTLTCNLAAQDLPTAKPEDVGVSSAKVEELSKFMQSLVDQGKIAGGVTMMARHGKVIHLKAVGMADREEKIPMRTDAIFRIASMTKPITSVAIMMLWEQGKLGLDDPVWKYIPEFKNPKVLVRVNPLETRPAKGEITIRHLLTHTSGLGYTPTEGVGPIYEKNGITTGLCTWAVPLAQMITKLAGCPLSFDPGDRFQYGMSTDVLGRVVEVASGMTLDRFIESQICHRIGMNDTFFKVPSDKLPRLVATYVPAEEARIRKLNQGELVIHSRTPISSDYPYADTHKCFSGGGGLCSTPADYMRFCQMLLNGGELKCVRLLRAETVRMMTINQVGKLSDGFGLGFGVMPDTDGIHEQLRGSYNWGGFWSTSFRISPRGDWIVITMTQLAGDEKATPAWFAQYEKIAAEAIQD